jgi:membrane protein implicated in regulation of membrane protease activity
MLRAQIEVMSVGVVGALLFLGMAHIPLVTMALAAVVVVGLYLKSDYSTRRALRSDVAQAKREYVTGEIGELELEKRLEQAIED